MPTPLEFEKKYRELIVTHDDGSHMPVDVHQYLLNGNNNARALVAKDNLIFNHIRPAARKAKAPVMVGGIAIDARMEAVIALCYMGKGSPADLAMVLRLVDRYGLADSHRGLQGYCDDFLGLDCNGFVGNYTKECGLETFGPSTDIDVFRDKGTLRTRIEDVANLDVMVWKNKTHGYGHITIIDSRYYGPWDPARKIYPTCVVVESSGGVGLHHSDYTLFSAAVDKATRRTVFTVGRANGAKQEVYIAGLNL